MRIEGGISSAYFVRANGNEKDGHGVLPDIKVRQSAEDMARNYDTVLEVAKNGSLNNIELVTIPVQNLCTFG